MPGTGGGGGWRGGVGLGRPGEWGLAGCVVVAPGSPGGTACLLLGVCLLDGLLPSRVPRTQHAHAHCTHTPHPPPQFNPADFFMDVTSMDYRTPDSEALTRRRIQLLGDLYQRQGAATAVRWPPGRGRVVAGRRGWRPACTKWSAVAGATCSLT